MRLNFRLAPKLSGKRRPEARPVNAISDQGQTLASTQVGVLADVSPRGSPCSIMECGVIFLVYFGHDGLELVAHQIFMSKIV